MNLRTVLMVVSLVLSVSIGLVIARGRGPAADWESGPGATGSGPIAIGLSLDTLKEARWQADRDLIVSRVRELGGEVRVQSANGDDNRQMNDVLSLLSGKVSTLLIVPHDGLAMAQAVERAHAAGVPVIAYDRIIRDCDLDLYLSFDNVRVGELQAQYLVDHLPTPGKGRIVRIYGAPTDNNAKLFKQGQDNALKPFVERGDVQVIHEDWAEDWKPENAKRIVNAAIARHGRAFEGVLASNDGTAGGAVQGLLEEGMAGKVVVTGQDAELPALRRIAAGTQSMTIYKPLKALAATAAETAVKMARGQPVVANATVNNRKTDIPSLLREVVTVTRENIVQTVVADRFASYDDIYRDLPEDQRPPR